MAEGRRIAAGAVQALLCLASSDSNAGSFPSVKVYKIPLGYLARRHLILCRSEPFPRFRVGNRPA